MKTLRYINNNWRKRLACVVAGTSETLAPVSKFVPVSRLAPVYSSCLILFLLNNAALHAQDTSRKKTIDITSTFKPVLREPVKINFSAALPAPDSNRPVLNYAIPQQQVKVPYQPGSLNPLAYSTDSLPLWQNGYYLKLGAGNNHLPYVNGVISFGDGEKSFLTASTEVYSSKGKLPYQKNIYADAQLRGAYRTSQDHEVSGSFKIKKERYFFYGYQPDTLDFSKSDLRQDFQTVEGFVNFRNINPTVYGITYSPNVKLSYFSGKYFGGKPNEGTVVVNLPFQKSFGKSFGFNLNLTADHSRYKPADKDAIKNTIYQVAPALLLKTPNVYLHTGIIPSWDNKDFKLLPNILGEFTTKNQDFSIQAGWIGYYNKASYQRFASINPWLAEPTELLNGRTREAYAGFKGSVAKGFTYSAKASYSKQSNAQLFVNDQQDGKTFQTVYSPRLEVIQLHGELGYMKGELFSLKSGLTYNNFTKIEGQTRAWGLIPLELNAALRLMIMKDLFFKSDLFAWDGPAYRTKEGDARKGDKAFDLNAGIEFRITRGLDFWVQANNLFNNKYQRWNQYHVYGFNILGGVVFRFNQK